MTTRAALSYTKILSLKLFARRISQILRIESTWKHLVKRVMIQLVANILVSISFVIKYCINYELNSFTFCSILVQTVLIFLSLKVKKSFKGLLLIIVAIARKDWYSQLVYNKKRAPMCDIP